jgi:hypothetical protein
MAGCVLAQSMSKEEHEPEQTSSLRCSVVIAIEMAHGEPKRFTALNLALSDNPGHETKVIRSDATDTGHSPPQQREDLSTQAASP